LQVQRPLQNMAGNHGNMEQHGTAGMRSCWLGTDTLVKDGQHRMHCSSHMTAWGSRIVRGGRGRGSWRIAMLAPRPWGVHLQQHATHPQAMLGHCSSTCFLHIAPFAMLGMRTGCSQGALLCAHCMHMAVQHMWLRLIRGCRSRVMHTGGSALAGHSGCHPRAAAGLVSKTPPSA